MPNVFTLKIDVGQLRHRVAIQQPALTDSAYGQPKPTWNTVATQWARITSLSGQELVNAQQHHAETTHAVEMRFNPDISIDPTYRLQYGTRNFNALSVIDVQERRIKTVVLCVEQVDPT